jgi:DNA-binding NtrC family response regulator
MRSLHAIVAHSDKKSAERLADSLHDVFGSVEVVSSADELRAAIVAKSNRLVITDLETVGFTKVAELKKDFGVAIVCTHRVPDEAMWAKALNCGAIDCCHTADVRAIVQAVKRNVVPARSHAA